MPFEELLDRAKADEPQAILTLFEMYRPMLIRRSILTDGFDDDTWQQQCEKFLNAIQGFRKEKVS